MTQRQLRLLAILSALLIVAGCDDSSAPELDPGTFSTSDAEAIADLAAATVIGAMESGFTADIGLSASAAVPVDFSRTNTHDCPVAGTITSTVEVSGDMTQGPSDLAITGSTTFTDCTRGGQERTVTMNGELVHSGTVTVTETGREANFSMTGELSWSIEPGEDGSCTVDLTVTFADGSRGVEGTVCGREVGGTS